MIKITYQKRSMSPGSEWTDWQPVDISEVSYPVSILLNRNGVDRVALSNAKGFSIEYRHTEEK